MKNYPGVSSYKVHYVLRRGPKTGKRRTYVYYKARIMVKGRVKFLGHFKTKELAVAAYRTAKTTSCV